MDLRYKCGQIMIQSGRLYKRNHDGIYLRWLEENQVKDVLMQFQNQENGISHAPGQMLAHQILKVGYPS